MDDNTKFFNNTIARISTFKVHVDAILSAPRLALPDDDGGHDLLPEIRLPFLDSSHHHIAHTSRRQPVQATFDPLHRYDVKVLRPGVIGTVHRRCHWKTQRHPELVSGRSSTTCDPEK